MTSDSFPARVGGNNYLRRACLGRCHSRPATAEVSASVSCIARVLRDWSTLVHDSETVFVTLVGLGSDDFTPYVFASNNRGATWRSISHGLPLEPVRVIREDPEVPGLLYLGTDQGVYVSLDTGKSWQSLCNHLPTAQVDDLCVHPRDNELVAGTHGLSVFVLDISPIRKQVNSVPSGVAR